MGVLRDLSDAVGALADGLSVWVSAQDQAVASAADIAQAAVDLRAAADSLAHGGATQPPPMPVMPGIPGEGEPGTGTPGGEITPAPAPAPEPAPPPAARTRQPRAGPPTK